MIEADVIHVRSFIFDDVIYFPASRHRFWKVQGGAHASVRNQDFTRIQAFGIVLGSSLAFISPIGGYRF